MGVDDTIVVVEFKGVELVELVELVEFEFEGVFVLVFVELGVVEVAGKTLADMVEGLF